MIECERTDGTVLRRRAREFWYTAVVPEEQPANIAGSGAYLVTEYVSLQHDWPNLTDTDLKYRIYTPEYELPADVVELRTARYWNEVRDDISVVNQYDMERYEYTDYRGQEPGRPTMLFRGKHHQIDAPIEKPGVKVDASSAQVWTGPDNVGSFQYCYTYVWGKREPDLKAPSGTYEPKWESAPSPVSDIIALPLENPTFSKIVLTLPNIDDRLLFGQKPAGVGLGFSGTDRIRTGRSGYFIRIYVRRITLGAGPVPLPSGIAETTDAQSDSPFYFLAEFDSEGKSVTYHHDGNPIPDYYRRLKEVHGYQTIRFHPMPDGEYEIDCRVLRRPQQLVVDTDAPRIHEEATEVLIQMSVGFLYELQGTMDTAAIANERAMLLLNLLTKRYGAIPSMRPKKRMARVRAPYREVRVKFTEN